MITTKDIKILKSERLTDEEDGGGRATGVAIVDNEINNLFPDISRLDRTLGRISLRKVFAGVITQNQDRYLGAHAIITRKPGDDLVSALLFNSDSQTDERVAARGVIEAYVVPSILAEFELMGDQYEGQRTVAGIQIESASIPEIGDVFQMFTKDHFQYFRITSLEHELREFLYVMPNGDITTFTRRVLIMGTSAPLDRLYPGGQPVPEGTADKNLDGLDKSRVRTTQVADTAKYFGISPLAKACSIGDLNLTVESIYAQLVPSAIKEVALVDQIGGSRKRYTVAATRSRRSVTMTFTGGTGEQSRSYLGTGVLAGSLELTISGGVYRDMGNGSMRLQSGASGLSKVEIDYESGMVTATGTRAFSGSASASYLVGAPVTGQTVTGAIDIKLGNRGFVYTLNLSEAKPRAGTLRVSFMTLGRWYELVDYGLGTLEGEGIGSVNMATGAVSMTLNAMPDVNSSILYSYVAQADFNFRTHEGAVNAPLVKVTHELQHQGVNPSGVIVRSTHGGELKTMTSNTVGEFKSDVATGFVNGAAGIVTLLFTTPHDDGSDISIEYETGTLINETLSLGANAGGMTSGTIPGAPLKPGTVWIRWSTKRQSQILGNYETGSTTADTYESFSNFDHEVVDDGLGNWRGFTGSINYDTGAFLLKTEGQYNYSNFYVYQKNKGGVTGFVPRLGVATTQKQEKFNGSLLIRSQARGVTYGPETETVVAPRVRIDILPTVSDAIIPGSLLFEWGGELFVDRDGRIYKNIDTRTNAGTSVGTIDYVGGTVSLTTWPRNSAAVITRLACLTSIAGFSTNYVSFRTPGSPLRPASLQVTAVRVDTAEVITATSDINGNIVSPFINGNVDAKTGIVQVLFSSDPEDETGESDIPVIDSLIRYNAVIQTSLPMSAKLLGLDPVRLPSDGRVPIYREGDVLVIHNTAETPATPTGGSTVFLGRTEQAEIYVTDKNDVRLDPAQYSVDREAGTLTWANPVVIQDEELAPISPPLTIKDRVEHMTVCTEAQITGALSFNSALPWSLPAKSTFVSSALTWGDMQARLFRWYSQKTWNTGTPNWSDFAIGDGTTAQYNQLNYPPQVTNMGAISGRWALVFTSASAFQIVEEKLGIVGQGSTGTDCAPLNPATNVPYFLIKWEGWGSGWAASNAVRFNTTACLGPAWVVRTILAGKGTVKDDNFRLQVRGDAD